MPPCLLPSHEEEEEEEEEEKDEAASLIPLVVFPQPLVLAVTCCIWFLPEEYNSALLGSTVDACYSTSPSVAFD